MKKATLKQRHDVPDDVEILTGFTAMDEEKITAFVQNYGLAMDTDDLKFCMQYFQGEGRDPSLTEIRMLDTYWSDHCRHTTFLTAIDSVDIQKTRRGNGVSSVIWNSARNWGANTSP